MWALAQESLVHLGRGTETVGKWSQEVSFDAVPIPLCSSSNFRWGAHERCGDPLSKPKRCAGTKVHSNQNSYRTSGTSFALSFNSFKIEGMGGGTQSYLEVLMIGKWRRVGGGEQQLLFMEEWMRTHCPENFCVLDIAHSDKLYLKTTLNNVTT